MLTAVETFVEIIEQIPRVFLAQLVYDRKWISSKKVCKLGMKYKDLFRVVVDCFYEFLSHVVIFVTMI